MDYFERNQYLGYLINKNFDLKKDKSITLKEIYAYAIENKIEEIYAALDDFDVKFTPRIPPIIAVRV